MRLPLDSPSCFELVRAVQLQCGRTSHASTVEKGSGHHAVGYRKHHRGAGAPTLIESFDCGRLCTVTHLYHAQALTVGNFPLILNTNQKEKNTRFVLRITQ